MLLVRFHIGDEIKHLNEWWGKPVNLDFEFFQAVEMEKWLIEAGFELIETPVREPNPEVEVATRRAYIFVRKSKKYNQRFSPMQRLQIQSPQDPYDHLLPE